MTTTGQSNRYWPDSLPEEILLAPLREAQDVISGNTQAYVACALARAKWWLPKQTDLLVVWEGLKAVVEHEKYVIRVTTRFSLPHQQIMEMRRRCERQTGLLIIEGQINGIYFSELNRSAAGISAVLNVTTPGFTTHQFIELAAISEGDFDAAIEMAYEEGNLSQNNVIRKLRGEEVPQDRSEWHRGKRRFDSNKAIRSLAEELEACCTGLDLIEGDGLDVLTKLEALESIRGSIATIQKEIKKW